MINFTSAKCVESGEEEKKTDNVVNNLNLESMSLQPRHENKTDQQALSIDIIISHMTDCQLRVEFRGNWRKHP